MRNIYSGTLLSKESKKKHQDRTRDGLENQLVGRSRRQREMDDFYDERRSKMKSMMIERQIKEKTDVQTLIGRPKNLLLIPNTAEIGTQPSRNEVTESTNTTHPPVKAEIDMVNATESDSVCVKKKEVTDIKVAPAVGPADIYKKLVNGVNATSGKKYRAAVGMIARLLGPEGGGWLSIETLQFMTHLIYLALMSPYLKDEKIGGDARLEVTKLLVKPMETTIIAQKVMNVRTLTGELLELPLDPEVFAKLELAWMRALIINNAFNDDILVLQHGISKLVSLIERHHSEIVLEMVKAGERNAYEAVSQTSGDQLINITITEKKENDSNHSVATEEVIEGATESNTASTPHGGDLVVDNDHDIWDDTSIPSIRELAIEEGLDAYFDLVTVSRCRRLIPTGLSFSRGL